MKILISIILLFPVVGYSFNFSRDPIAFKKQVNSRTMGFLSERTHKLLTRAQEDLNKKNADSAFSILNKLVERTKKAPHEQAQVLQALGYAYAQKDNTSQAKKSFERALELEALPLTPTLTTIYILGQMYAIEENHAKAESALKLWLALAPKANGPAYAMLASAQMAQGKKQSALKSIQKAIDITPKPQEAWLAMAVSLYFQTKQYGKAARVLKVLVAQNPKKATYWKQWSQSHLSAGEEKASLVALELADIMNLIKEQSDYKNMASLMMTTDLPYKAAMVLEKKVKVSGLKDKKLLAAAYMSSRDNKKALGVLRDIHKNSPDVRTSIQLGQVLLDEEKWGEAYGVFNKAKGLKPDADQKEQIYTGMGVSAFNQDKLAVAKDSFLKIASSSDSARTWLENIRAQEVAEAQIAAAKEEEELEKAQEAGEDKTVETKTKEKAESSN